MDTLMRVLDRAETRPRLVRSALYGAGIAGALTVYRAVALLPIAIPTEGIKATLLAAGALALCVPAGAIGGLFFGLLEPLRRLGWLGLWVRWAVGLNAFAVAVIGAMYPFDDWAREVVRGGTATVLTALFVTLIYATGAMWVFQDELSGDQLDRRRHAAQLITEATEADLVHLRAHGHPDLQVARVDLVERRVPSLALTMHLSRVLQRLGRGARAPGRELALRRAHQSLAEATQVRQRLRERGEQHAADSAPRRLAMTKATGGMSGKA
jgi:hypothetical protein